MTIVSKEGSDWLLILPKALSFDTMVIRMLPSFLERWQSGRMRAT